MTAAAAAAETVTVVGPQQQQQQQQGAKADRPINKHWQKLTQELICRMIPCIPDPTGLAPSGIRFLTMSNEVDLLPAEGDSRLLGRVSPVLVVSCSRQQQQHSSCKPAATAQQLRAKPAAAGLSMLKVVLLCILLHQHEVMNGAASLHVVLPCPLS
jgi:hypothetical protein